MSKKKLGLVPRLIIGIIVGIILGSYAPEVLNRTVITLSSFFSSFLKFIIPLMILAFVTTGIADLTQGAGKLLLATVGLAYSSTLIAGTCAYILANNLFPYFITTSLMENIGDPEAGMLSPFFGLAIPPMLDVISAVTLAFILGLCISSMRGGKIQNAIYDVFNELTQIINTVLHTVIIPLLPLYICGTFINMTVSGQTLIILNIFLKVFATVIALHLTFLLCAFIIAGLIGKKNPAVMIKNQIPGYITAIGTQSSAATIPVNLECAENNGISREIRNFVIPLCANIHLAGSMITITSCITAVLLMYQKEHSLQIIVPFILVLGVAMVAAPGAPGGAIMTTLPFLPMVDIASDGTIASLLIALYITQDSFGTACNVSGDNAIAAIIDTFYHKMIKT